MRRRWPRRMVISATGLVVTASAVVAQSQRSPLTQLRLPGRSAANGITTVVLNGTNSHSPTSCS